MSNQPMQPIYILPEGTQRTSGRNAQRNNILAAKLVAETVRTTLGPKGMDKMLVDSLGNITVTNDGVTILQEMHVEHPAARMLVDIARTQEREVGDGTTTAVVLAGELLANAEQLLDQKIHPTVIIKGYRMAAERALEILAKHAQTVTVKDDKLLMHVAATAMTGKGAEAARDHLSRLAVDAVKAIGTLKTSYSAKAINKSIGESKSTGDSKSIDSNKSIAKSNSHEDKKYTFIDRDAVTISTSIGAPIGDTRLIEGIVLEKDIVHPGMPRSAINPSILLLDTSLEIKDLNTDAKVSITDPKQFQAFFDLEDAMLRSMTQRIVSSGAQVVFCQKGIDDLAAYHLSKEGIIAVRRIKKSDIEKLAKATGAKVISDLNDISAAVLGNAGSVREERMGEESLLLIEGCEGAKAVTILVRGGTQHVVEEVRRALTDAIGDLKATIETGHAVPGAGAIEIAVSRELHTFAASLTGRERLAVESFARSLEVIPRTLAENAGLDPIDVLTDLKAAHVASALCGIDVMTGKIMDAWACGVIEPVRIKTQAITSATDVATMILRIDDVIASGDRPGGEMQQPQD